MNENANQVGQEFDVKKAVCRDWEIQPIHKHIIQSGLIAGSWGFKNPVITVKDQAYRFRVSGRVFSGFVTIVLNGMDLFDIYFTSIQTNIVKKIANDVYIEDLIERLDDEIERIPQYKR